MTDCRGAFTISRKLFDPDDEFFGGEPFSRREAWQWLISEAAFKQRTKRVNAGRGETWITLERGQLSHSRAFMQKAWGWSSEKMVRTFLDRLEKDGRITRKTGQQSGQASDQQSEDSAGQQSGQGSGAHKGQHQTIITICKYDEYQPPLSGKDAPFGQQSGQASGQQSEASGGQASGQQKGPDKGQNKKNDNNDSKKDIRSIADATRPPARSADFEKFKAAYPKRQGSNPWVPAEQLFNAAVRRGESAEVIVTAAARYSSECERGGLLRTPHVAQAQTWLRQLRWKDYAQSELVQTSASASAPADPRAVSPAQWQQRVAYFRKTSFWKPDWGAPPGQPGCFAPSEVLTDLGFVGSAQAKSLPLNEVGSCPIAP